MNTNPITPYLFFGGNCKEAMNFYKKVLGGELQVMTYGEAPGNDSPPAMKDRVMHAYLKNSDMHLMASDFPEGKPGGGDSVNLSLQCKSLDEIETLFKALSEKGKVTEPLNDTFWGARFGMLTDQYGFRWMLSFEKPKK